MIVRHVLACAGLIAALGVLASPARAQQPGASSTSVVARTSATIEQARSLYVESKFQAASNLLADALRDGRVTGDDLNAARALRARCLAKLGRRIESKELFKAVLRSDANFRLDPLQVPPDEMDSFDRALREFQAEQVEAGKRYPSSLGLWYGRGQGVHQDIVDLASSAGVAEADDFESSGDFGLSVRFPLKPRWSLDIEVSRLRGTTEDQLPSSRNAHATYTVTATPVVATLLHHFGESRKLNLSAFVGAGLMPSAATIEFERSLVSGRVIPTQLVGEKTGLYLHAGGEGELFMSPRFALSARVAVRRASSGKLDWPRDDFELYETYPQSVLGERSVDFSGLAAHIGVRAYIGY